jgi:hypothetical protein
MGQRKKLIFVSSADPRHDPEPIRPAYLWATTAAKEGLEAEVRLVGEAVRAAHPDEIKEFERIDALREGILAGASGNFLVSL